MKIVIDWNEYITWCNIIPKKILEFGLKTDYIYGIPRGGLIPGTIISYQLDIPCLYTESDLLTAIHSDKKTVVIVDDILDSGTTVENLWKKISIKGNESSRVKFFFVLTKGKEGCKRSEPICFSLTPYIGGTDL